MGLKSLIHKMGTKEYRIVKHTTDENFNWYTIQMRLLYCKWLPWVDVREYHWLAGSYVKKYQKESEAAQVVKLMEWSQRFKQSQLDAKKEVCKDG